MNARLVRQPLLLDTQTREGLFDHHAVGFAGEIHSNDDIGNPSTQLAGGRRSGPAGGDQASGKQALDGVGFRKRERHRTVSAYGAGT